MARCRERQRSNASNEPAPASENRTSNPKHRNRRPSNDHAQRNTDPMGRLALCAALAMLTLTIPTGIRSGGGDIAADRNAALPAVNLDAMLGAIIVLVGFVLVRHRRLSVAVRSS